MRKRLLIGCGIVGILGTVLLATVVLLVGGVFELTRPVVDSSEQFLTRVGQGKVAEAYAATADGFRGQLDEAAFAGAVRQLGLSEYATVYWYSRHIENQEGTAEGTVTTKSGGTKPVSIRLVRESGNWKVAGVRYGGVDLVTVQTLPSVPSEDELKRMVTASLLDFNRAIRSGDFAAFYDKLSAVWKKQTTPGELQKVFQEFIDKNIDISAIVGVQPRVTPPAVNEKDILVVAGHYPTQPSQVRFELEYARDRDGWKLTSIGVNVGKGDAAE
jgi:hypothetical protein